MDINNLKEKIKNGYAIKREEAIEVYNSDYESLTAAADELREYFVAMTLMFVLL